MGDRSYVVDTHLHSFGKLLCQNSRHGQQLPPKRSATLDDPWIWEPSSVRLVNWFKRAKRKACDRVLRTKPRWFWSHLSSRSSVGFRWNALSVSRINEQWVTVKSRGPSGFWERVNTSSNEEFTSSSWRHSVLVIWKHRSIRSGFKPFSKSGSPWGRLGKRDSDDTPQHEPGRQKSRWNERSSWDALKNEWFFGGLCRSEWRGRLQQYLVSRVKEPLDRLSFWSETFLTRAKGAERRSVSKTWWIFN